MRKDSPVTLSIRCPCHPICPFCLHPLPLADPVIVRGLFVCRPCWIAGHRPSRRWLVLARRLGILRHFTAAAGVSIFTPQADWPANTSLMCLLGLPDLHPATVLTHRRNHPNEPRTTP